MPCRRSVFFSAFLAIVLALPAYGQYGYHFGRNKIQYEDFDWHVLKTDHFNIYYYPEMEELAEHGASFAETAYKELQNRFNYSLTRRVPLIFYSSNIHFKQTNVTPGFIPDGVGGFFEFLKGRVVVPSNGDIHRFRRVIRHELVHVFTHARTLRVLRDHGQPTERFLPLWFTEGLAEYWSGSRNPDHEMMMHDALFSNYLVPMDDLHLINGTFQMYKQGEAILHFISETYGEEKILQLIENVWKDENFKDVMSLTLHEEFDRIDARWQSWLKDQYYPRLEEGQVPSLITDGIATRGFSSKPAYYEFPDGTRKVYFLGNRDGYTNVYEVAVDSAFQPLDEPEVLIEGEREERFEAFHLFESRMSISAGGKLAFVTKSGGQDVVHVYHLPEEEMGASYRFDDLVAVYSPTWSPDGEQLAFSSIDESGFTDLYVYHTGEGTLRRLTDDAYDDRNPDWSPDGEHIAFSSDRTAEGASNAYNVFTYALSDATIDYVTYGRQFDFEPRWSPSGDWIVFTSVRPDDADRFGARNIWAVGTDDAEQGDQQLAAASKGAVLQPDMNSRRTRTERRLTGLTTAAYDPAWVGEDKLVYTAFEHGRFTLRKLERTDSLLAAPHQRDTIRIPADKAEDHWAFGRVGVDEGASRVPYRGKYSLDVAQGQVSQTPIWGTSGGAVLAFSDLLGDDYWYLTLYNTGQGTGNFLENLSFSLSRVQLKQRTNVAYGMQRFSGLRYDITDPTAGTTSYPVYRETLYGSFGNLSYPLSKFRRLEVNASLNWTDKRYFSANDRRSLLLSNSLSLVHDNALYRMNGPAAGWRGRMTAAYTSDIAHSHVNYFTLVGDVRNYLRIVPNVTFASWFMGRFNHGRRSRLFVLGGSWDLRGFDRFDLGQNESVRGNKMWFTSHELRFPILMAPYIYIPVLRPFGVTNLRGALFFDAAHAWNEGYHDREPQLNTGETLGAIGAGLRLNIFGGLVLRYDVGYRYRDGFRERIDDGLFRQFFFGYDF